MNFKTYRESQRMSDLACLALMVTNVDMKVSQNSHFISLILYYARTISPVIIVANRTHYIYVMLKIKFRVP